MELSFNLKANGRKKLDVSVVDLPDNKEKALNIALNKHSGAWDYPKLKDLIIEIDVGDIDIEVTGFDENELGNIFGHEVEDLEGEWEGLYDDQYNAEEQGIDEL